jgi:hypothetical protein
MAFAKIPRATIYTLIHRNKITAMQSKANTVQEYIDELPEDRKVPVSKLRETILANLPAGFEEGMGYGMVCYVVPHSLYPPGYASTPKLPLPFVSLASQKNYIAFHHMGIYTNKALLEWFIGEYPKHSKQKLDMGKGCIRFKKPDQIPYALIGELMRKVSVEEWIKQYEAAYRKGKK